MRKVPLLVKLYCQKKDLFWTTITKTCNTSNNYFINITKTWSLKPYKCYNNMTITEIISTFDNHISIKKVKECFPDASNNSFEFTEVSQDEVKKEVFPLCK